MRKKILFIMMILLPFVLSALISFILPDYKTYYSSLNKPFNIPAITFPIVWTIIYLLIGYASYLVIIEKGNNRELKSYYINLFFNITWVLIFFGFRNLGLSVIWIFLLLISIVINAIYFYRVNKLAGLLFIPYFLWTVFATYLTIYIYFNN